MFINNFFQRLAPVKLQFDGGGKSPNKVAASELQQMLVIPEKEKQIKESLS